MTHEEFEEAVADDARGPILDTTMEALRSDLDRWHDYLFYLLDDTEIQIKLRSELQEANEDTKTPDSMDFHAWKARVLAFKRALMRRRIFVRSLIADRDGGWRRSSNG